MTACASWGYSRLPIFYLSLHAALLPVLLLTGLLLPLHGLAATYSQAATEAPKVSRPLLPVQAESTQALRVLDIGERTFAGRNQLSVILSHPVDRSQDIQPWLLVSLADEPVAGGWQISDDGRTLRFDNTEPQQNYQIEVQAGLPASNGLHLLAAVSQHVETRALTAGASFSSDGLYIVPGQGLPVEAVNVAEVNIDFLRVAPEQVQAFLRQAGYSGRESWYSEDLARMTTLVHSDRYQLNAARNTRVKRVIELSGIKALSEPGLYMAVMTAPGHYRNEQYTWFRVTDMGLHARIYDQKLTLFASSLQQGSAFAGAEVTLLDQRQKVLTRTRTDSQGKATLPYRALADKARAVKVVKGDQQARLLLQRPALDLSEFRLNSRPWQPQELFIYGPRDLYRAGETLQLSALLRSPDGRLTEPAVLQARILRPDGSEAMRFSWQPEQNTGGYYQQQWSIPASAPLGRWAVEVDGPFRQPVRYSFQLEDFMPERMRLSFSQQSPFSQQSSVNQQRSVNQHKPQQQDNSQLQVVTVGQSLQVAIKGEYLHGAPAVDNRLEVKFLAKPWRSPLTQWPGYQFGDSRDQGDSRAQPLVDLKLDAQGQAQVRVPAERYNYQSPMRLRLQGRLYETGGRAVSRYYDALFWPGDALVGVKPAFGDANPAENSKVSFSLIRSNLQGQLQSGQVLATLIREERQYFWSYNPQNGWHYQWTDKTYPVASEQLMLSAQAPVKLTLPVDWGWYRLELKTPDGDRLTSLRFHAGEDWYRNWQQSQSSAGVRPDQASLVLDRPAYKAGDIARVRVTAPHAGKALLILESGEQLLWLQRVELPKEGATFEVPVPVDQPRHDLYLSVVALRPAGSGDAAVTPARALGLVHLPLDRSDRKLKIDIDLPEQVAPAQTLKIPVHVSGAGKSTRWMTLSAVDSGILNLTDYSTPNPFDYFFGPRRYSVELRDLYHRVVETEALQAARPRFGGDADLSRGGEQPQADVQIVSLFSGPVQLDSEGHGEVELTLPYFNGELQLMAQAWSHDGVGSVQQPLTVVAPLVTQLAMPRFMASGDQSLVTLTLQNRSGQPRTLNIVMKAQGGISLLDGQRQLTLADGARAALPFIVTASEQTHAQLEHGQLQLHITEVENPEQLSPEQLSPEQLSPEQLSPVQRQWQIPVRAAWPVLTESRYQLLQAGEQWLLNSPVLQQAELQSRRAHLTVSNTPQLPVTRLLEQQLAYPYRCLEQTVSRGLVLLNTSGAQLESDVRQQALNQAVARISELQRDDGSFGLWSNQSPEEHWLTAYATDFLLQVRDQGIAVSPTILDKALQRLQRYLSRHRTEGRWSENPRHYTLAWRAYAGYLLSRVQQAPLGQLRTLYQQQKQAAASGLPLMHLALALHNMGDQPLASEALQQALQTPRSEQYLGDYGSDGRDLAAMIVLLGQFSLNDSVEIDGQQGRLALQLMQWLSDQRWLSPQSQAALYQAGQLLAQHRGERWQLALKMLDETMLIDQTGRWHGALDSEQLALPVQLENRTSKPLYVTLASQGRSAQPPPPLSQQLAVERYYYSPEGEPRELQFVETGELILVELVLEAAQRTPDALLVDMIPAGFELENPALAHAAGLEGIHLHLDGEQYSVMELQQRAVLQYQAFRDDRYIAALALSPGQVTRLFYLMRAVTPGSYQPAPALLEDMYRPERRAIGETGSRVEVVQPR
ncbi:MAG: alpha-2-macroglobulin family protein [Marinobacterium sp.]|nr:alpha-2-macroglobulin family protein [Marinobacterium sp.]